MRNRGDSIITSRPGGRWAYTFFVILSDDKLVGGWYLVKVHDVTVKKISMKYFCMIKEKIAYMDSCLRRYRTSLDKRLTIMTCFAF